MAWINLPLAGIYEINTYKEGVTYDVVRFDINENDVAAGVVLYIASPPHSVQGSNDSAEGEN